MNRGSRKWIKLWVDPWLSSTMRFTLDHKQRAVWADLLAMGGQSRVSGVICSGEESGQIVGIPLLRIAGLVDVPTEELSNMLMLFEKQERIKLSHDSGGRVIITILNWSKYQSEYDRQKKYRRPTKRVTKSSGQKLQPKLQLETAKSYSLEVEGEVEGEEKNKNIPSPAAPLVDGFDSFWNIFPRKEAKKEAQKAWAKIPITDRPAIIAAVNQFKLSEQWQKDGGQFIPYAATFLNGRRWEDELPTLSPQIPAAPDGRVPRMLTAAECRPER